ncbi:cytochrome P450 [Truncatella angustata]|uniref:Cytochrome P450 n=1 Tax=Truncatella angustata TaxID=152316 RepID=A0A9P8RKL1_9PEZI|nr:cytochrome P450 [Truncatella angustata]KAH6645040.1 cytochrome P450 [Truncatella angustata]
MAESGLIAAVFGSGVAPVRVLALIIIFYNLLMMFYNLVVHPLRSYPGPLFNRISRFPRVYWQLTGQLPFRVRELHDRYGTIIRLGPNELAFRDPVAWKDIYGRRANGDEMPPEHNYYHFGDEGSTSMLGAEKEEHDRLRRYIAPGFSERAIREQEPVIGGYVDLLIQRLQERCDEKVDMTAWLNYTTFDIIGYLSFGSDFGCLENADYHPWVKLINGAVKDLGKMNGLAYLGLAPMLKAVVKWANLGLEQRQMHERLTDQKLKQRLAMGGGKTDFIQGFIDQNVSFDKLKSNASVIIIAGSETTATLLTGAMFLLATHRNVLEKLNQEVRSRYKDEKDITITSTNGLSYMLACLNEALRCYPPVAWALPRSVPKGGGLIAGQHIPENTIVGIWQWAMFRSPTLFYEPDEFHPERFLRKDPRFVNDKLDAVQPFILGPRNCIGQNIAYAEMRLILAKLIWNFDFHIADDSRDFLKAQKIYLLWDKPRLNIHLAPVCRR